MKNWPNWQIFPGNKCPFCGGTGTISEGFNYLAHQCQDCGGKGYYEENE